MQATRLGAPDLPLVALAVEAMCEESFNLYGIQTTTHQCAPLVIVNGPVAQELRVNAGHNAFGPGWQSNATTVTVIGAEGPHNVNDHESVTGRGILRMIAGTMTVTGANDATLGGGEPVIVFGPEHAATVAADGYAKLDVKRQAFIPTFGTTRSVTHARVLAHTDRPDPGSVLDAKFRDCALRALRPGAIGRLYEVLRGFESLASVRSLTDFMAASAQSGGKQRASAA